ncbi:MAG: hypothetical protein HYV26_18220 [Candidatus Hydrogenedentes bacterium]|nr:hypothetical protein [Candidatus Hydrogenedentota bacterium]MBI3117962.1 hypothetical protein [Candidatus Hydrogenedentota bacterium]
MHHLHPLTKTPCLAEDIAPEVKLTFLRDVLNVGISNELLEGTVLRDLVEVMIPLFVNKDPENPVPPV